MASLKPAHHFLANKRIIISGAGISGLAFAVSLHKLWPSLNSPFPPPSMIIYERDPCAVPPNREGYSLSIHSGRPAEAVKALQKMGLLDTIMERSIMCMGDSRDVVDKEKEKGSEGEKRRDAGGVCIWDKNFEPVMKINSKPAEGVPVAAVRIARAELRRTLAEEAESLPDVTIRWGEVITSASSSPSGTVQIETEKGEEEVCDLLIAADGASSKLRGQLRPDDTLSFAGPTLIGGKASIFTAHPSGRADEFGPAPSGAGVSLFISPIDREKMIWMLSRCVDSPPEPRRQPMSAEASKELLEEARQIGGPVYSEKFGKILESTDMKSLQTFNAMDKQPFAHTGTYITGDGYEALNGKVVFLGDANHAMSPFAGNGACLALMDGWDFAESVVESASQEEANGKYDKLAVGRAKQVIGRSHFVISAMHSKGWLLWFWMNVMRVIRWLFFKKAE